MQHGWRGKAVGVACAGALASGGAAVPPPNGDPGPPEQAQGNGPPATPPGQAKQQQTPAATTQSGGDADGKSTGGQAKARGNGHTGGGGQASAGGGGSSSSRGHANGPSVNSQEKSSNGHAGKMTICHATHSSTNPYVEITVSNNAIPAHDRHQDDEDMIPAPPGGCPGGASGANPPSGIVSGNVQLAGMPEAPLGDAPASGVLGVSNEGGTSPVGDRGGGLGTEQGGVEGATQVASTSGGSLPFTGLAVGLLLALGALLAATGFVVRRRAVE